MTERPRGLSGLFRPSRPRADWYSEYAICPMCGHFNHPTYHQPGNKNCAAPGAIRTQPHNHLRCRCGFEWTLAPRDPDGLANEVPNA